MQSLLAGGVASLAVRDFLSVPLCREWLLMPPAGASPAALWWQQQVLADNKLLRQVVQKHDEACWRLIETGAPFGAALLGSKQQLRVLLASKSFAKRLRGMLGKPAGAALLQALLQQQVWAPSLLGACPAFDR